MIETSARNSCPFESGGGVAELTVLQESSGVEQPAPVICDSHVSRSSNSSSVDDQVVKLTQQPPNGIVIPARTLPPQSPQGSVPLAPAPHQLAAAHSLLADNPTNTPAPPADKSQPPSSDNRPTPTSEASGNKLLAAIMATGRQHPSANDPNFKPGHFDLQGAQVWLYSCKCVWQGRGSL